VIGRQDRQHFTKHTTPCDEILELGERQATDGKLQNLVRHWYAPSFGSFRDIANLVGSLYLDPDRY